MKLNKRIKNEEGSVLIVALIMLVLLSMIGISANRTASIDILIAGNEMVYKQNLFSAEAASMEGMQRLEDTDLGSATVTWLTTDLDSITDPQITTAGNWTGTFSDGTVAASSSVDTATRYVAISKGIQTGSSLGLGGSRVYSYEILGRSAKKNGESIVATGYKKAF